MGPLALGTGAVLVTGCAAGGNLARLWRGSPAASPSPTLSAAPPAQPAPMLSPAQVDHAVAQLDGVVRDTMARTGVPGLSAAVVYRGEAVYLKGFGVRRAGSTGVVGPGTVFQLASVSKPLAGTVIAGVVGRKAVSWSDPVVRYLPEFALKDPWVSAHVTVADLLSHRSGLPDHAGDLLEDLGYGRDYILSRLRYEPLAPFRASYAYTNFGFTAAAVAVAAARKTTWEDLSADVLYKPLGMRSTSSRFSDYERAHDKAVGHVRVDGRWEAKYTRDPQAQSPAGGASSTAGDMAAWLRLQLANGKLDGTQLIDAAALDQTHLPQITAMPPHAPFGRAGFYGLGWDVNYDDQGRLRLSHSGGFDLGASTAVALLPSERLGIVVLTNGQPVGVPETVAATFFDIAQHGRPTVDWLPFFGEIFAQMAQSGRSKIDYATPPAVVAPAKPYSAYTGTYANDFYGPLTVAVEGEELVMRLGPQHRPFPLRHYTGDTFSYLTEGENAVGRSGVRFTAGAGGTASEVTVENLDTTGLGTFTR